MLNAHAYALVGFSPKQKHGRRASPQGTQRQLRLCSSFAVVVVLVSLVSLVVLVVPVVFIVFVVLVLPFVFDVLVVCAAGAVLHVVVAEVVVKQNKEASTKAEQIQSIKQKTEKQKTKNIEAKKQRSKKSREANKEA